MKQPDKKMKPMTRMQKIAGIVCLLCLAAILITAGVTAAMVSKRAAEKKNAKPLPEPVVEPTPTPTPDPLAVYYQVDNTSASLLHAAKDAGEEYLQETLFVGDSNTARFYQHGLLSLQQFCAREGLGIQGALSEKFVNFKGDKTAYTVAESVAKLKPRRVIITLGTNDAEMSVTNFVSTYTTLIEAIQEAYPHADIIVSAVPPVPENHSKYPRIKQESLDDFNMALLELCEKRGLSFLNTAEILKDEETGYGKDEYFTAGDIHLRRAGLEAVLEYVRTHPLETEDRRPDTKNIPTRVSDYRNTPSAPVTTELPGASYNPSGSSGSSSSSKSGSSSSSSSKSSSSASSSEPETIKFKATYQVEKGEGGTLRSGEQSGKVKLTYGITDPSQSVKVTAVPASGYLFIGWSDGVNDATRTDSNFKKDVSVTAIFSKASVSLSGAQQATVGETYSLTAKLSGEYAKSQYIHWYAEGHEVTEAFGLTQVDVVADESLAGQTIEIYAAIIYHDSRVTSNKVRVKVNAAPTASGSSTKEENKTGEEAGQKPESSSSSAASSDAGSEKTESASSSGSSKNESASSSSAASSSSSKSESAASSSSAAASSSSKSESASSSSAAASSSSKSESASSADKTEEKPAA